MLLTKIFITAQQQLLQCYMLDLILFIHPKNK